MRISIIFFLIVSVFESSTIGSDTNTTTTQESNARKPYIVYMGDSHQTGIPAVNDHHNLLVDAIGNENIAKESRIHSYGKSFNAFAAMLLPHEAESLQDKDKVVSVFPSQTLKLHTTSSWDFLGMPMNVKRNKERESDIIVGLLDTGINMESESFKDEGFGPPPAKWKGTCQTGPDFPGCNNKVIGARYYDLVNRSEVLTPTDKEGHGTHTASTLAGNSIIGASYYGLAEGIARGGVPSARLAMYKVCWNYGCSDVNMLAAFDDAIHDGVDVISVSVGGFADIYYKDATGIGTFHAMRKGIFSACSAGNNGPGEMTVVNGAPWIMTVAASTMDRLFETDVKLGNGSTIPGFISINTISPENKSYPLISGSGDLNDFCDHAETIDPREVEGKIVYCFMAPPVPRPFPVMSLPIAGLINAMITPKLTRTDNARDYAKPAAMVNSDMKSKIVAYINSTRDPRAVIYKSIVRNQPAAPFLASFSSRGPFSVHRTLIKPDISAPAVEILASWSKFAAPTVYDYDKRRYNYSIVSGTSMASPHVAAAAVYIKTFHPEWSPAAIKSALMTTARPMKPSPLGMDIDLEGLGYGAGLIEPTKALDPGLIYDLDVDAYIGYLCKDGFNDTALGYLSGTKDLSCTGKIAEGYDGINYPSFNLNLEKNQPISAEYSRTVTNVGSPDSVYTATVKTPADLHVTVIPNELVFKSIQEKKSFKVVIKGPIFKGNDSRILQASLAWTDNRGHKVTSPILVYRPSPEVQIQMSKEVPS